MSVSYVESTTLVPAGSRTSVAVPVPTGAAAKDIAVVAFYKEMTNTITPPAGGWSLLASDIVNATTEGALFIYWKRLTAADTGTYTFSWTGSTYAGAHAIMYRGCIETGNPWYDWGISRTPNNSGATISRSVNAISGGAAVSFVTSWATSTRSWSITSGWGREEQTVNEATGRYLSDLSTGSMGPVVWTGNGNDFYQMFLGVLRPVPSGPTLSVIVGGVKKPATAYYISGGVKKPTTPFVIAGGVKKT